MKKFLRFNFQLLLLMVTGLFFQNSRGQVLISTHNINVTTPLTGWNGTLPNGYTTTGSGSYVGTSAATTGGLYAVANAGFGYQASGSFTTVSLTGTYRNNTGSTITSLQISYKAFVIVNRDSRRPNWTVTSTLGDVSALTWTFNASNTVANPVTKTVTLTDLDIAANSTFSITFASDRGTGSSSSPLIGLKDVIVKSIVSASIDSNTNSISFDDTEVNENSATKTATITSSSLISPINVVAPANFEVSANGTTWGNTTSLPASGGTLYTRFSPLTAGISTGNITMTSAGAPNKLIAVSGTGVVNTIGITTDVATFGPFCNSQATTFNVNFSKTGTFIATDFSVQLSNADGTFPETATNIIGTGTTSPISATIPANTIAGNYRIRILNENPLTFSNDNGSNIVMNTSSVGGTVSGGTTFCSTTNSGTLTLTNYVGSIIKWQVSTSQDFTAGVEDLDITAPTLPFSDLPSTYYVRAVVANGNCDAVNSDVASIVINTTLTAPDFAAIPAFCSGSTAPTLALVSPNGITGTWLPATVSNTTNGTYVFTPDAGQCASTQTLTVTVTEITAPDFAAIPAFCSGSTAPVLALTSPNGITGTWSPATISNTTNGTYVFTPDAGQCASTQTLTVTVTEITAPDFAAIPAFCSGSTAPVLALTSPNGITGTWSPATVSNTTNGTYVFTPNAGQCASTQTLTVTVNEITIPDFSPIPAFCSGSIAPTLALVSPNGITGTWSPATISNTTNGTYVFTPNAGQCASTQTLTVTVNEITVPDFAAIPAFCSGSTAPTLPLVSPNGITGTWSPATISNTTNGTYVFTPDAGQCASPQTLTATANELTVPDFAAIPAFCSGSTAPTLPLVSPNGITGTWSPATISNTTNGTYVFTPNAGQCASPQTLTVMVNVTLPPAGNATQDFTTDDTLEDFIVVGQNIKWYDALTAGNELQNSEIIVSGTTYYVSQTVNGCESTRLPITAGENLSTDSFDTKKLKFYPNPTNAILNLEYSQAISSVKVYNLVGQQVLVANPNASSVKVDLSNLNSGTYFVNIASENNSKTIKVIKR